MTDRRKFERHLLRKLALLRLANGAIVKGQTRNIGDGGVFVDCQPDSALKPGETCRVSLVPDNEGEQPVIEIEGEVIRHAEDGVGLIFLKINSDYYQFLDELSD